MLLRVEVLNSLGLTPRHWEAAGAYATLRPYFDKFPEELRIYGRVRRMNKEATASAALAKDWGRDLYSKYFSCTYTFQAIIHVHAYLRSSSNRASSPCITVPFHSASCHGWTT